MFDLFLSKSLNSMWSKTAKQQETCLRKWSTEPSWFLNRTELKQKSPSKYNLSTADKEIKLCLHGAMCAYLLLRGH